MSPLVVAPCSELIAVEDWRGVNKDRFFSNKPASLAKKQRRPSSAPSGGRGARNIRPQFSTSSTASSAMPTSSRQTSAAAAKRKALSASNRRRNHTKLLYRGTL